MLVPPSMVARPLPFHSDDKKYGYILYQGTSCEKDSGWGVELHGRYAFSDEPQLLLEDTSTCQFAHSSKDFKHEAHENLIYCVAFESSSAIPVIRPPDSSRLFSSTDFFNEDKKAEDLGVGKNAKGVTAFAIVSKFAVVAVRDMSPSSNGEMLLYVTVDTKTRARAQFPHASSARLRENAYTVVESTTHSLG
ncbi:hypothetical protein F5887DRAFT_1075590 [Amanita rubescens]|nr:hypothetical protein F5887DRAFT_1075590 [Amanita rubescens]